MNIKMINEINFQNLACQVLVALRRIVNENVTKVFILNEAITKERYSD